jgi:hypothetical protein
MLRLLVAAVEADLGMVVVEEPARLSMPPRLTSPQLHPSQFKWVVVAQGQRETITILLVVR